MEPFKDKFEEAESCQRKKPAGENAGFNS